MFLKLTRRKSKEQVAQDTPPSEGTKSFFFRSPMQVQDSDNSSGEIRTISDKKMGLGKRSAHAIRALTSRKASPGRAQFSPYKGRGDEAKANKSSPSLLRIRSSGRDAAGLAALFEQSCSLESLPPPSLSVAETGETTKEPSWGWTELPPELFHVRGKNYLNDRKKVPSEISVLKTMGADLWKNPVTQPAAEDLASKSYGVAPKVLKSLGRAAGPCEFLIFNIQLPGPGGYSVVKYFMFDHSNANNPNAQPAINLWHKWAAADQEYRDARLKLVPIINGLGWTLKKTVSGRPVILGLKIPLRSHRHERSMEVVLDVSAASPAAAPIAKMIVGGASRVILDIAIVIEAKEEAELPEMVLGCFRLDRVNLHLAADLPADANSSGGFGSWT